MTPCLTLEWARLPAPDPCGALAADRASRSWVRLELNEHLLLDLARAGLLWTGAQHEDRHRPLDPRAVRWQERSGFKRLETTP